MADPIFEMLPLASITPYGRNPRAHSKKQVAAIAASIASFGFTNPILIDETGEIIAGHGRYLAAKELARVVVPTIRLAGLTFAQKAALRIADNKLALSSTWSIDLLVEELATLTVGDIDIELTGFDTIEIDRLLTPTTDINFLEETIPNPPREPISKLGDVWELGLHRVVVGDAREPDVFGLALGSELADLVITDPPYNVKIAANVSGKGQTKHGNFAMASGEMSPSEFAHFLSTVLTHARNTSKNGSLHYVFTDWRAIGLLDQVGKELYSALLNIAVWVKSNAGMGSFYRSQHEMVAVFKNGTKPHVNNIQLGRMGRHRSNVWQYPGTSGFSKTRNKDLTDHPTVKPVGLLIDAIRDASGPGDLILDPFGGSGSTLLAAHIAGRRATLIEIDPAYVDVILRRFHEHAHIEPLLLPERTPLSSVRRERVEKSMDVHDG